MPHVLVIDDDPAILKLIGLILERAGYDVHSCTDPLNALEYLKEGSPNVIVSDMSMPHLNGLELLQEVRKNPKHLQTPFVFLSSHAERSDIRTGMSLGADDYLGKPFTAPELLSAIEARLTRHQQLLGTNNQQGMTANALGQCQVIWQGQPVIWASRKAAELFFFLLEKNNTTSWEAAEALWPEKDEERASSLFHTTLHRLRKSLYPEAIASNNRRYSLQYQLKIHYDVHTYRQNAQEALSSNALSSLETAANSYQIFLPGFDSDWCLEVRQQLQELQLALLIRLAEHMQPTNSTQAIHILERAIQLDPLADQAWQILERLLLDLGDSRASAAAQRIPWWPTF